ncbi:hypothetical protein L2E82_17263 [Cichorium intybus]|uniref:Uncharacterized protein n=1 Tax=Cichorium intybus TaxID=13427 RepID=A0ACB9F8F3_CICIN|nr:hypothetical protein L2E82_17263 [Cichorium intybus]
MTTATVCYYCYRVLLLTKLRKDSYKNKYPRVQVYEARFPTRKELTFFIHSSVNESPKQKPATFSLSLSLSLIQGYNRVLRFSQSPFIVPHLCC